MARRDWRTYGKSEYTLRASLRSRPDRDLCVFRIDAIVGQGLSECVFLDRAQTPVAKRVLDEWSEALETILTAAVAHRHGIQLPLGDNTVHIFQLEEGGPANITIDN